MVRPHKANLLPGEGNPFKFGTRIHLDSRTKQLDFGCQRSKVMVMVIQYLQIISAWGNVFLLWNYVFFYKHSLGLEDELIIFWWSKVKRSRSHDHALFWMQYIRNVQREFHYVWHKHSLRLKDDLNGIWWSKNKVTVTSQSKNVCLVVNVKSPEHLEGILSHFAQTFTWT